MPRNPRRRQSIAYTQTSRPWLWLSAGLLLGGLLTFLASPQNGGSQANKKATKDKIDTTTRQHATKRASADSNSNLAAPPRFEFYTLLPEMEEVVLVPESNQPLLQPSPKSPPQKKSESEPASSQTAPSKTTSAPSEIYVLQAGSFRSHAQADKRKADLALIGVEATIQTITIDGSKTWHRVRIGPSTDLPKLYRIRQQLHESHIESQLFKVKS